MRPASVPTAGAGRQDIGLDRMGLVSGSPVGSHLLRRLSARSKCSSSTRGHRARTAVARAAMPLRARRDSACAIAQAVDRRYRPMNSELWQLIPDRWLLTHLHAAPSRSTSHRQGEWSRTARTSGGRPCVGRLSDRTVRSSAPLHAERLTNDALFLFLPSPLFLESAQTLRVANLVNGSATIR